MDPLVKKLDTWWVPLLEEDDLYDEYMITKRILKELFFEGNICLSEMYSMNTVKPK